MKDQPKVSSDNNPVKIQEKIAIIAGNGPSLKEIDYKRLPPPNKIDIFRCNQFYFEDKYYLGKSVKYVFFNLILFFENYYTAKHLLKRGEYTIENIGLADFGLPRALSKRVSSSFDVYYADAIDGKELIIKLKEFYSFIVYNEVYENRRITSAIYMVAIAIILGYKVIYLAGIDFYEGEIYGYNTARKNILRLDPNLKKPHFKKSDFHTKEIDLEALKFLVKHYDIQIYSLCPNSALSQHFPLAALTRGMPSLRLYPEAKNENYTNDILIPSEIAYNKRNHEATWRDWRSNSLIKFMHDIKHFPKDIIRFLRRNYENL